MEGVPLLGLEYLVEVESHQGTRSPTLCLLCAKELLQPRDLASHCSSPTHRLQYLEAFFPVVRRKFARVPDLRSSC